DDHYRNLRVNRLAYGRHHRLAVLRSEDDAVHVGRDFAVDNVDLCLGLVLLERAVPIDIDSDALLGLQIDCGALGPAVDRLPEFVGKSLGDDGNAVFVLFPGAAAAGHEAGNAGKNETGKTW